MTSCMRLAPSRMKSLYIIGLQQQGVQSYALLHTPACKTLVLEMVQISWDFYIVMIALQLGSCSSCLHLGS